MTEISKKSVSFGKIHVSKLKNAGQNQSTCAFLYQTFHLTKDGKRFFEYFFVNF